jgi:DNA-binding SARP family transcriptional activator
MPQNLIGELNLGIEIRLLGDFFIRINSVTFSKLNANRHQALIAYLALHAPQPVQRSEVAFHLWADSNEEQALTNLRKALHLIKQSMPESELILSDAHTLQLNLTQNDLLDILDFKSGLDVAEQARRTNDMEPEQTALETAVSLYQGDLLPNCYDEWLIPKRECLRDLLIRAMDRLVALLEARKHYRDAIKYAQRLLQADRLREETYRALIRLHALNEDRAAALSVYYSCVGTLSRELGVEPDSSTQELYKRLVRNDTSLMRTQMPVTPISHPLVAREQEWKILLGEWKHASNGNLWMTVLTGEAGIGKTRLAEDLLDWASHQGIHTASATCYSAEGQISFAPVSSWLRSMPLPSLDVHWQNELVRILPELRGTAVDVQSQPMTETWQQQVFFEAMARVLLSHKEPILLLLDDIQWCDVDTLEWLRYFMRFDKKAQILILATLRAEELSSSAVLQSLFLDLKMADQITEIDLERLDEKQTTALGAHLLGRNLSEADSLSLFRASEGVPLFVVELTREGLKGETIQKTDAGKGGSETLPPRLRAVIEGRLARLSVPARVVAESAAILGREFDFQLLRRVSELDEQVSMYALDELWRRRMLRERNGFYDFSHAKLREVTLAGISPVRVRWLHQRAGEALEGEASPETYGRIADHFEQAGITSKSIDYYSLAAGHAQQVFAFTEALENLKSALLLETRHGVLADLHEQRGDVLKWLGLREESLQSFAQALGLTIDHLQRARLARKQVALVSRYDIESARQKYESAIEEINFSQNEPAYWHEWIELQFEWIQACYWQQDSESQDQLLEQTKQPVEYYGTLAHKIKYHHHLLNSLFVRERYVLNDQHVVLAHENEARAIALGNSLLISTSKQQLGMVAFAAEKFDLSASVFLETIDLSQRNGDTNSLLIARVYLTLVHRRLKNSKAVFAEIQLLMALLQKVSKSPQYEAVAEANYAWLAYCEGNKKDAQQHAQTAVEIWRSLASTYPAQWTALIVLFALAVEAENIEDAFAFVGSLLTSSHQRLRVDVESALLSTLEVDLANKALFLHNCRVAVEKAKVAGYL